MSAVNPPSPSTSSSPERRYGVSAVLSGARVAARAWRVVLPVVVLHAVAQALLVAPDPVPGTSAAAAVLSLASFVAMALALALVVAAVIGSVDGAVSWGGVLVRVRGRLVAFALWFLALLMAMSIGLALWVVPGLLVVLLTPYLLLAAMDRRCNALTRNLAAIRARLGRWLLTSLVIGLVVGISWLLAAVSGFFVRGPASALIVWLWLGLLAAWFQAAWAVIYRSTAVGAVTE